MHQDAALPGYLYVVGLGRGYFADYFPSKVGQGARSGPGVCQGYGINVKPSGSESVKRLGKMLMYKINIFAIFQS